MRTISLRGSALASCARPDHSEHLLARRAVAGRVRFGDVCLYLAHQIILIVGGELEPAALARRAHRHSAEHTPVRYRYARSMSEPTRGYTATKEQLGNRLRRIEGQVRGIQRMVDEDRYCIDVVTQISAVQAALDKVALGLLDDHSRHCIAGGRAGGEPEELSDELMGAVARLLRRG